MHPFNPNGLFGLGANAGTPALRDEAAPPHPSVMMPGGLRGTMFPSAPPNIPCWRRRAAWINTAGSFDATWCADARGSLIHRDPSRDRTTRGTPITSCRGAKAVAILQTTCVR